MDECIKTIVFDLDGTIYQNNTFHYDYIHFMLDGTDKAGWEKELVRYVDKVYCGQHLIMNSFYINRRINAESPAELFSAIELGLMPDISYEEAILNEDCIYLGDAWAVVNFIGKALGVLDGERYNKIYKLTREKMSLDGIHGNGRLLSAVKNAGQCYTTVLLSNSYEATAKAFLKQLGFDGAFSKVAFSADKPREMTEKLGTEYPELYIHPKSFLTIGDHAFNDLMPLQRLGCKTIWINPFTNIHKPVYDKMVHTLDELAQYLESMCDKTTFFPFI